MLGLLLSAQIATAHPSLDGIAAQEPVQQEITLKPSTIPVQVPLSSADYEVFREAAAKYITPYTNQCALFVNRLFQARFGRLMFGNAWELQLHPDNAGFLDLVWRLGEDDYDRSRNLALKNVEDRVEHFEQLYDVLDHEKTPVGVIGFLYQYSAYREYVADNTKVLPQTHITFLAGRKAFRVVNGGDAPQTIREILTGKYGVIHDFEEPFLKKHLPLDAILAPEEDYVYVDYLIEEQFKTVTSGSLLEVFLRKHRNNHITPLVRPVSYSRVSQEIIDELQRQKTILSTLGRVEMTRGREYENLDFPGKSEWEKVLQSRLGIENTEKALLVPIPVQSVVRTTEA